MLPADDQVAGRRIVPVRLEVAAPVLELDSHPLPPVAPPVEASFGLAIGERGLDGLDKEAEFPTHHTKEVDHSLLVDRGMAQTPEVYRAAELESVERTVRTGRQRKGSVALAVPGCDVSSFQRSGA